MKLSAVVLLSVNFVAASQVAANAADTASFLQEALTAQAQSRTAATGSPSQRSARQRPASKKRGQKAYVAMTPVVDGVKIRPFMPGRYLPSQAELEAKRQSELEARQAAYIPANDSGILSGQVSANNDLSSSLAPVAAYAMSRPANQVYVQKAIQKVKQAAKNFTASHSRSLPGLNPVMPGQVAQVPSLGPVPEPRSTSFPVQVPQPPSLRTVVPKVPNYVAASPVSVPPPALTKYESSQLERLVESNLPENVYAGFNGDMRASGQGNPGLTGGGPPPFPLSSMPMNSVRPAHGMPAIGSQARFGSWHGGHSNLPQAAFQSYVPIHTAGPMSVKVNHFKGSHKTGRQAAIVSQHKHADHVSAATTKPLEKKKAQPKAASYAPYRRYTGLYL